MQTSTSFFGAEITELTAINVAKAITIFLLLGFAIGYGINDLHVGYCSWWLLEQWLFPLRREQIFTSKVNPIVFLSIVAFVGIFYALPGYLAFINPQPIAYATVLVAVPLYVFGSLINTAADIQKMTAKSLGAALVKDEIWRSVRHINYLGDLMRYLSFSIVSGSIWAYVVPATILLLYVQRIAEKERSMPEKYADFADYQQGSYRLLPWLW
jgi:protein-S-isoprenylcysteine O-methyltransferase Ste14